MHRSLRNVAPRCWSWLPLVLLVGCAGTAVQAPRTLAVKPAPAVITESTYRQGLRSFQRMLRSDPHREPLRERLLEYLLAKSDAVIDSDDYEALVGHLAAFTSLYRPVELDSVPLPAGISRVGQALVERGSPRGDEARVLSALKVMSLANPQDKASASYYKRLLHWSFDSRAVLGGPLESYDDGLVEALVEHARLTPTTDVLATLAQLYVDRRDALVELFSNAERSVPISGPLFHSVQRGAADVALNVAAVYLRHADLATAQARVEALGTAGAQEIALLQLLEAARQPGVDGASGVLELGSQYGQVQHTDVALALFLYGVRTYPNDPRFRQKLGLTSAKLADHEGAMAWYSEAIEMAPDRRELYDEVLTELARLMEMGMFEAEVTNTRRIANHAVSILEERVRRWPEVEPPVLPQDLYLAIGIAEMNAGNTHDARQFLRKSLGSSENVRALLQLGLLEERAGARAEAVNHYKRALQLLGDEGSPADRRRAEILEDLGDVLRLQGEVQEASRMYEEGLALWDAIVPKLRGRRSGLAHLRRGVLLDRLGRWEDAQSAFEQAMEAAPGTRETYATILSHMVVGKLDAGFAHRVFRHAVNQLSLAREWKVYFALWLQTIALRSGERTEHEVRDVFEDFSPGDDWSAQLARFGAGKIDYQTLLASAQGLGERTEAHFYEGARRLSAGDTAGARAMFEQVLGTQMVNFYEFAMAQELLASMAEATPAARGTAATAKAPESN